MVELRKVPSMSPKDQFGKKQKLKNNYKFCGFFRFSEKSLKLLSKHFCTEEFSTAFRVSRRFFWWFSGGNTFRFFHFWTLTKRFLHFVQKVSTWAKHFRPFGQRFLRSTSARLFTRPFKHLEIFWVTFRNIQHRIEKNSKTSMIFVTWEKQNTLGQLFFDKDVEIAIYVSI